MATSAMEPLNVNGQLEDIEDWLERFDQMADVHDAVLEAKDAQTINARKVALLLSRIGADGYRMLKAHLAPELPKSKTYDELITAIRTNFAASTSIVSESFKLSQIKQETSETLNMFMSRVKMKASKCNFGDSYDRMVRDRFICGLRSERTRAFLISDDKVDTAAVALQKAVSRENSYNDAHQMNSVNAVKFKKTLFSKTFQNNKPSSSSPGHTTRSTDTCSKCTLRGHSAKDCKVRCRFCRKPGHIKSNCHKLQKRVNNVQGDGDGNGMYVYGEDVPVGGVTPVNVVRDEDEPFDYAFHVAKVCHEASVVCSSLNSKFSISTVSDTVEYSQFNSIDPDDQSLNKEVEFQLHHLDKVNKLQLNSRNKCLLNVLINGKYVDMEIDTGSEISCMSKVTYDRLNLVGSTLTRCPRKLIVANGQTVSTVFKTFVFVRYKDTQYKLVLRVVESEFPTLLGRDWMDVLLGKGWFTRLVSVNHVKSQEQVVSDVVAKIKSSSVFQSGVGKVEKHIASLDLKQNYKPKFCKARTIAYAEKERIGMELDRLESSGYIKKVNHSEWASPIVVVNKSDGGLRLCGDYKRTLNPNLDMKVYPLPNVEDCFVAMKGGVLFSKIDIKQAYNSLPLREDDQILTTINTHQGLYKFQVLPYGVNSASAIFQSTMDKVLSGMTRVTCRVDDILITGLDTQEHANNLLEVIKRLEDCGFKCRLDKSVFFAKSVIYLGYEISQGGVRPCRSKVETLSKANYPENLEQLISFLGAAQYYSRFIENMATLIEPLNKLRTSEWKFGPMEKASFDKLKKKLISNTVLTFYDPKLPLRIDCDASSYGLGAVLSHIDVNGVDRPIEFISRTLSPTERRYSQIDREALSIVWSVKRFHRYVYARPFELLTDHEPLQHIYNPDKGIPEMGSSRVLRWAVILSAYQFTVKYRSTKKHGNADVLSRFPLPETDDGCSVEMDDLPASEIASVFSLFMAEDKPLLNVELMSRLTKKDTCLSKISYYVSEGWPASDCIADEFKAFHQRRTELTLEDSCLLWGNRVIVPEKLRGDILNMLHSTHMGISSMKQLARNYVWWPKMDADIEVVVKHCQVCQENQRMPPKSVPHPWVRSQNPWERVHLDYAGPFKETMWLIVVDSYSKWIEVFNMRNNIRAVNTIRKLEASCSRFGLPKILVSDNAPQLVKSYEFDQWCKRNGITHIPIPSYHASSNGQAESIVGSFKSAMKKMCQDNADIEMNLAKWLLNYHNTPHPATNTEPSVLMMGRRLRSHFSLINPLSAGGRLKSKVREQESRVDSEKTLRRFEVGDAILYRDVLGKKWNKGTIKNVSDKVYEIDAPNGQVIRKHVDHVVKYRAEIAEKSVLPTEVIEKSVLPTKTLISNNPSCANTVPDVQVPLLAEPRTAPIVESSTTPSTPNVETRPKRVTAQPDRLGYSKLGG